VAECLLCKCKALSSTSCHTKKKKRKKKTTSHASEPSTEDGQSLASLGCISRPCLKQNLTLESGILGLDVRCLGWALLVALRPENFQILCVPPGRINGRTHGCKWSLLKVRKGKYKGEQGSAQVESGG
jgi:hypothetical protein